jgi:hypothetical protein
MNDQLKVSWPTFEDMQPGDLGVVTVQVYRGAPPTVSIGGQQAALVRGSLWLRLKRAIRSLLGKPNTYAYWARKTDV